MDFSNIPFYPAAPNNYTPGRQGGVPLYIDFHHAVGSMESVRSKAQNEAAEFSSHFTCGERGAWQFVDTDNTAWCDNNWAANLQGVTIEFEGDWRNGYRNEGAIAKGAQLVALIRRTHPSIRGFRRHNQLSTTACPCDLPCEEIWDRATTILNPPKPTPTPAPPAVPLQITDVTNRIVTTIKDANLWDLDFTTWATAKSVKVIPKGTEVEISAVAKHPLGGTYYLTEYSFSKGIKNGINVADCADKVVTPPPTLPPPIVILPTPIPVPPKSTDYDKQQDVAISAIKTLLLALTARVDALVGWIKGFGK